MKVKHYFESNNCLTLSLSGLFFYKFFKLMVFRCENRMEDDYHPPIIDFRVTKVLWIIGFSVGLAGERVQSGIRFASSRPSCVIFVLAPILNVHIYVQHLIIIQATPPSPT